MPETFLSRTYFDNDGTIETYAFDWPYLLPPHVLLLTRPGPAFPWEVLVQDVDWEFTSANLITLLVPPFADGTQTVVRRQTPNEDLLDRLTAPSTLSVSELNVISTQLLYLIQEALDAGLSFEGNAIGDNLDDILSLARFSYDLSISGILTAVEGVTMGPILITRPLSIPAGAAGSRAGNTPEIDGGEALFDIELNGLTVGTLSFTSSGYTLNFPSTVFATQGDAFTVVCTQEADNNFNPGLTLRCRREDFA